jgi:hypothetical protein
MISAPNISQAQFVDIERRARKYEDRSGETVQMEKFQLARFYDVPYLSEEFLRTFGQKPIHALDFLEQVVDADFKYDRKEIGRHMYPPQMAAMARELLAIMGFKHALDAAHETDTLSTPRSRLAGTAFFRQYSENVKLFHARAVSVSDVLAYQKTATIALNHVFSALGLHAGEEAWQIGGERGAKGGEWKAKSAVPIRRLVPLARTSADDSACARPPGGEPDGSVVQAPSGGFAGSQGQDPDGPKRVREGVPFQWPELVQHRRCGIIVGLGEEDRG